MTTKHVPCPSKTLKPNQVEAFTKAAQNQFVTVKFYTVKGEERTYNGQLKATSRLVGNERGKAQSERMAAAGQKWLALPNGQSRSFFLDRVVEIRSNGAVLSAKSA